MTRLRHFLCGLVVLLGIVLLCVAPREARAYVEAPHSLGQVVNLSQAIMVLRVESVDRAKKVIVYRKVRDLKGQHKGDVIRHNIGDPKGGFPAREWTNVMNWADVGKTGIFFHNGGQGEMCTGKSWYQIYASGGEWWGMTHGEPFMLRSYSGNIDKLAAAVVEIAAGKEVIVSCMVDGPKDDMHFARGKIQRVRASLKLDYNPKRDFVGWGGEDFRRIAGMPGFTHFSTLASVGPDAQSISAIDFNGDGKMDLCLGGAGRLALLQNAGEVLAEVGLPGSTGCRAAVWADYNGDGKPDLLLATSTGPKLFTNLGNGFRDDSHLLPKEAAYNLTAAAWIDYNGDGKPDVLLGNGFHGLRLYRNKSKIDKAPPRLPKDKSPEVTWAFEDVSDAVGLGEKGVGSAVRGDTLTVCDVDGDGRPDFLYGAGTGILVRNTPRGFVEVKDSGIDYVTGKVGPVFGDYDGDGRPDLFVPQADGCKLFRNDGKGKFTDVTKDAGLADFQGKATCAAWGDVDNDGKVDLVVGCLRGPNRFFRNKGDGTFEDASEAIGLTQRIFNTQAVALVDLNNDGVLDMVFNNEGQDACVLLGNPEWVKKRTPVTLQLAGKSGITGSRVRVHDKAGKLLGQHLVSGGDGRGGQASPTARFALMPGTYRVEVLFSNGEKRARPLVVASNHVRAVLDEKKAEEN